MLHEFLMKRQKANCSLFQNFLPFGRRERLELETRLDDEYYREVKIRLPYLKEKGQTHMFRVKLKVMSYAFI